MDPDANVAEQARLEEAIKNGKYKAGDFARLRELREALSGWVSNGGFKPKLTVLQARKVLRIASEQLLVAAAIKDTPPFRLRERSSRKFFVAIVAIGDGINRRYRLAEGDEKPLEIWTLNAALSKAITISTTVGVYVDVVDSTNNVVSKQG